MKILIGICKFKGLRGTFSVKFPNYLHQINYQGGRGVVLSEGIFFPYSINIYIF
jgi:hypothetical protein